MKKAVLITDASQRKSVPIIRSLGEKGIPVITGEDTIFSMGFFSKYSSKRVIYPSPEDESRFIDWLVNSARSGLFDILFPIDDRTMEPVTKHLSYLEKYMIIPIVDREKFIVACDKAKTIEFAASVGIPVPYTIKIESENMIKETLDKVKFPAVIKPLRSSGSRGIVYVHNREELYEAYMRIHKDYPFPLVQECIKKGGNSFGVEMLCNHGRILRTFVHRRIREYPINGGPSTLRESYHYPELVEYAGRLLSNLCWHGVAMVEFKESPDTGKCVLMEINPRFWGSIALPIKAKVDFPHLLYQVADNIPIGEDPGYAGHVLCRWLIPGDLLHFIANRERFNLNPSFFQFKNMHYDLIDFNDVGPLIGMMLAFLRNSMKIDFWKTKIFR